MLRSIMVIALLASAHVLAADFSGRWAGTIETNASRIPIYLTLSDNDGKITGLVATGTNLKQVLIEKAEIHDGQLWFEVHDNAQRLMQFRLSLSGGVLGGEATVGTQVSKVGLVQVGGGEATVGTQVSIVGLVPVRGGSGDRLPPGADSGIGSGSGGGAGSGVGNGVYRVGGGVSAPVLIHKVEPEYTEQARAAKYQGTVLLYTEIAPDGSATNIRVQRGLGLGLNEKAVEAVRQWKFKPGQKDGKPVTVVVNIEVNFRL